MDVYIVMGGNYHEEVPIGVFSSRDAAQRALDAYALAHVWEDPFLDVWTVDGAQLWRQSPVSPDTAAAVLAIRAEHDKTEAARKAAYVKNGGVLYSTSSAVGGAASVSFEAIRDALFPVAR